MENMLQCIFLVLWLQLDWLHGKDEVEQSPESLSLQEGGSGSLNCSYTTSNFRGLLWYRQDAERGLTLLFSLYSAGDAKQKDRLGATLSKKGSFLHITSANLEDSATYLCACMHSAPQAPADCTETLQQGSETDRDVSAAFLKMGVEVHKTVYESFQEACWVVMAGFTADKGDVMAMYLDCMMVTPGGCSGGAIWSTAGVFMAAGWHRKPLSDYCPLKIPKVG
ncbi:uncharacterized protein LOC122125428 [Dipodomys spectabilis]|uniref:uncharacterized protein LOC122125428 n=1 Tax=Dipodomys spectabilis TaxID=105255 RepID=UPI001C542A8A|nr:uncharacterized protein LOC122125428 [Dipodomys spectabilis]